MHDMAFGLLGLVAKPQDFDVKHIDIRFDELKRKHGDRKRRDQQTVESITTGQERTLPKI